MGGENVNITIVERLLNMVAPYPCMGCGFLASTLCPCCLNDIIDDMLFACWSCHSPSFDGICDDHKTESLNAFWVAGWRETVLEAVIDTYKFNSIKRLSRQLAEILDARLPILPENTVLVPVPTKSRSIRVRGYDHTMLLVKALAGIRGLDVATPLAVSRKSKTQHFSNKLSRQEQIQGSFFLPQPVMHKNRPHLLVDDIVTTGATLLEAHKVLVESGVDTVWLAALARQPLDEHRSIC